MKPLLIMTVGLPRSGKSTWARETGHPVVNPDSIRLALHGHRFIPEAEGMVWTITRIMVRSLFLAGHAIVVLDATNTNRKRRDEWKDEEWDRAFKVIDTPAEECLRRAAAAGDDEIIPIIERMAALYEPLGIEESV